MASPQAVELFRDAFGTEVLETTEDHPDIRQWAARGRGRSKANPDGEDGNWWQANGPALVQNWMDWRRQSRWTVWVAPDGRPAIELALEVEVDGIQVWVVIDRVMDSSLNELVIVDLKTGVRTPESDLQLAFYRLALHQKYGVDVDRGAYWMARKGEMSEVFDLSRYKPELMAKWIGTFDRAVGEGIFLPHPTFLCRACEVREYCAAFGGRKAELDPDYGGQNE